MPVKDILETLEAWLESFGSFSEIRSGPLGKSPANPRLDILKPSEYMRMMIFLGQEQQNPCEMDKQPFSEMEFNRILMNNHIKSMENLQAQNATPVEEVQPKCAE